MKQKTSQTHRTMEWLGLESSLEMNHFQPSCHGQRQLPLGQVAQSPIQLGLVGIQFQKQIQSLGSQEILCNSSHTSLTVPWFFLLIVIIKNFRLFKSKLECFSYMNLCPVGLGWSLCPLQLELLHCSAVLLTVPVPTQVQSRCVWIPYGKKKWSEKAACGTFQTRRVYQMHGGKGKANFLCKLHTLKLQCCFYGISVMLQTWNIPICSSSEISLCDG